MPTPAQVLNRLRYRRPDKPDRTRTGTVVTSTRVAVDIGGAEVSALPVGSPPAVGDKVLLLLTSHGTYILGKIGG